MLDLGTGLKGDGDDGVLTRPAAHCQALEVCKSMGHKGGKLSPEDLAGRLSGGGEERERNRPS